MDAVEAMVEHACVLWYYREKAEARTPATYRPEEAFLVKAHNYFEITGILVIGIGSSA